MSRYVDSAVRIVAERHFAQASEKLEMLKGFGFSCSVERHCGFWLIYYRFPELRLVADGHAVRR